MIPSLFNGSVSAGACSATNFAYPTVFGAEFISLEANLVSNFSRNVQIGLYTNHGGVVVENLDFCNVTLTYTHPGQNDTIHVQVWMPSDTWNGRLQMIGGAGWQAGLHYAGLGGMAAAAAEGYASFGTDAGLGSDVYPTNWALTSEGNVNLYLLQDLASVSLNDAAIIAKDVVNSFYGQAACYTYYSGCSQGGRQGLMLAQRYPDAFDGIAASAPAINWAEFFVAALWPSILMDQLGEYPPACEFDAITAAAIEACDGLDGVVDNVISNPDLCDFNPSSIVGQVIKCEGIGSGERPISTAAAIITQATWNGPKRADNSSIWFGLNQDSQLTDTTYQQGIVSTTCASNGTCTLNELDLAAGWVTLFVNKSSNATARYMSRKELEHIAHLSKNMYESIISTNDPDLSEFRARGGKIIGYHGLADNIIAPGGSKLYYDNVLEKDPNAQDFYRLFFAPGVSHCFGGPGAYPDTIFDSMREWVENGVAPATVTATSTTEPIISRPLCPYPQQQKYDGVGNSTVSESFYCE